ncbi:MAG: hemerythrin family protein [Fibrobacteres bacterium]|nr:hemerythrin family protein [Fibrobacterota bacterium]
MTAYEPTITWNPDWELGIEEIDDQHRRLVRMIAALQVQVRKQATALTVDSRLIHELLEYALTHFKDEEGIFRGKGWEGEAAHMLEHQNFMVKARGEMIRFQTGSPDTREALLGWLVGWLKNHIAFADREHGAYLHGKGLV